MNVEKLKSFMKHELESRIVTANQRIKRHSGKTEFVETMREEIAQCEAVLASGEHRKPEET